MCYLALPDLSQTSREPVITVPGADAYLSCKVKDLGNHTVLFRKLDAFTTDLEGDLLTVGNLSLQDDNRYQVLHERSKFFFYFFNFIIYLKKTTFFTSLRENNMLKLTFNPNRLVCKD